MPAPRGARRARGEHRRARPGSRSSAGPTHQLRQPKARRQPVRSACSAPKSLATHRRWTPVVASIVIARAHPAALLAARRPRGLARRISPAGRREVATAARALAGGAPSARAVSPEGRRRPAGRRLAAIVQRPVRPAGPGAGTAETRRSLLLGQPRAEDAADARSRGYAAALREGRRSSARATAAATISAEADRLARGSIGDLLDLARHRTATGVTRPPDRASTWPRLRRTRRAATSQPATRRSASTPGSCSGVGPPGSDAGATPTAYDQRREPR